MTRPVRLQLSRRKGFDLQAHSLATNGLPAVSCARPGILGNPFPVDVYGREGAVDRFRRLMLGEMSTLEMSESSRVDRWACRRVYLGTVRDWIREEAISRKGHNLACWCGLDQRCHADTLLEIANR